MLLLLFTYIKFFFFFSATAGGVCIVANATVVGTPVGIASAGFTIAYSLATANFSISSTD